MLVAPSRPANRSVPDYSAMVASLRGAGLVRSSAPLRRPLAGGISSDILLVEDQGRRFVVKRALTRFRVRDTWFADVSRSRVEQAYLRRVDEIIPGGVPRVLFSNPAEGWFAMEFLGGASLN